MIEIFHFLKFYEFMNELEKTFSIGENGINSLGILPIPRNFWLNKIPWRYTFATYVCKSIAVYGLEGMNSRDACVDTVSVFVFTIIFGFLRTLPITLILYERYMCCSMKVQNKSPCKYIAYSIASYWCLSLIRSGI